MSVVNLVHDPDYPSIPFEFPTAQIFLHAIQRKSWKFVKCEWYEPVRYQFDIYLIFWNQVIRWKFCKRKYMIGSSTVLGSNREAQLSGIPEVTLEGTNLLLRGRVFRSKGLHFPLENLAVQPWLSPMLLQARHLPAHLWDRLVPLTQPSQNRTTKKNKIT